MPADGPARGALKAHGGIIITKTPAEAVALANEAAPEHLVVDDDRTAKQIRCAGSLFVGPWSAQVAGDYAIGSNHVLPTAGAARVRGGLSAADFVRQITVQRLTPAGLRRIGRSVVNLAGAEGLSAHAASVAMRIQARVRLTTSAKATVVRRSFTRRRKADTTTGRRRKADTTTGRRRKADATKGSRS